VGQTFIEGAITLGKVSDDQLISAYSNAAVTISASLQEFFGYSTAESLACGTPVISFNYGGAAEMLVDGFNGWLVKSEVELSNRLKKIFDSRYSEEMRANARNSSDRFSLSTSATKFIELLRKIE
jgi:glycosyltransferase involved in cell wall biosynthesis